MKATETSRYRWYVVAMLWSIAFFNYADRQAIFSVFPLLESELDLGPVELGLLGSAFAWVYGICAPFAGRIVDRISRRSAILWGLQAWSIICAATGAVRGFPSLLVLRGLEGLGETFYFPASMSLLSDYHGKKTRSRAIGLHQTSVYVGTIAGGFFAGLIAQYHGWRMSFVVFGVCGIILGLFLRRSLREPDRGALDRSEAHEVTGEPDRTLPVPESLEKPAAGETASAGSAAAESNVSRSIWRTPSALLLMSAFMCDNFVGMVLLTWMPKFLYDKFSLTLAMAGLTATVYVQLASMAGALVGGWLADRFRQKMPGGRMLVQAFGVFCGAPFVILCGQAGSLPLVIAALTAWGFFKGIYDANIFASLFDVVPARARGRATGIMNMMGWLIGAGTAPIVIGVIAKSQSLDFAISIAAIAYVGAAILLTLAGTLTAPKDSARVLRELRSESTG